MTIAEDLRRYYEFMKGLGRAGNARRGQDHSGGLGLISQGKQRVGRRAKDRGHVPEVPEGPRNGYNAFLVGAGDSAKIL